MSEEHTGVPSIERILDIHRTITMPKFPCLLAQIKEIREMSTPDALEYLAFEKYCLILMMFKLLQTFNKVTGEEINFEELAKMSLEELEQKTN